MVMESPSDPVKRRLNHASKIFKQVGLVLGGVSLGLTLIVGGLELDILPATLVGIAAVGLNFLMTQRIILGIIVSQSIPWKLILFYHMKLGVTLAVLYGAIVFLKLSPIGILIGVSSIVISALIYGIGPLLIPTLKTKN